MRLFSKRPLSLILCIMLCGFSLFAALEQIAGIIVMGISLLSIPAFFIFKNIFRGRHIFIVICVCAFIFSVLMSLVWQLTFYPSKHYNKTVKISATVSEVDDTTERATSLIVKTNRIEKSSGAYTFIVKPKDDSFDEIKVGDKISFVATIIPLTGSDGFDGNLYEISRGISAVASDAHDINISSQSSNNVSDFFGNIRNAVSGALKRNTNEDTGAFLSALLTGERIELDTNTRLNFRRVGISHVLALSGMHLAILALAISKLLSVFRLNKKAVTTITAVFTVFYMALTGFSPSVTRAGIMLIISSVLFLLSRSRDAVTTLFIAVSLIVAVDPTSIFDISLLLSAFATFGVIFGGELTKSDEKAKKLSKKILAWLTRAFLSSVFAVGASFIMMFLFFRSFSVISLFSTIVFSILIEIIIYLGLICLAVGWFIPIRYVLVPIVDFTRIFADKLSSLPWIEASFDLLIIKILTIIFTVSYFALAIFASKKRQRMSTVFITIFLCLILLVGVITTAQIRADDKIIYSPSEASDVFLVKSSSDVAVIAVGTSIYSAYSTRSLIQNNQVTFLDRIILPSYDTSTVEYIEWLISSIKTETVLLSAPQTTFEARIAEDVATLLSEYGTKLKFFFEDDTISIGNYKFISIHRDVKQTGAESNQNVFTLRIGEDFYTYFSRGAHTIEKMEITSMLNGSHTLIFGHNGNSELKSFGLKLQNSRRIIFGFDYSVTDETVNFYNSKNIYIKRIKSTSTILD